MDTLIDIIKQRHSRIKSASSRADIGLYNWGGSFVCYGDDADKVNDWLAGTGLCSYAEMSPEPWDWSLAECSIPLTSMDKAVHMLLQHASVGLVDHVSERSVPQYICFLFLKKVGVEGIPPWTKPPCKVDGTQEFFKHKTADRSAVDPLADVF